MKVRIGTCSWADEALSKHWYPKGTPAGERLRFYAEHFDTVEVDSTYYRLPAEEMVARWAERTPEGFVMHVKAFGVMTRHPVKAEQLPPDLRAEAPSTIVGAWSGLHASSAPRFSVVLTRRSSPCASRGSSAGSSFSSRRM